MARTSTSSGEPLREFCREILKQEAVLRQGTSVDDLWLIAARNGPGTRTVTLKGLPGWAHRGAVYTENRTVTASHGMLHDRFNQWDVHVYHFVEPLILRKAA